MATRKKERDVRRTDIRVDFDYKDVTRNTIPELVRQWMLAEFGFWVERWTVTPEGAREILNDMGQNRAVKTSGLSRYASTMEKGRWRLSPQGIIFDENMELRDGQHRLNSVILSGVTTDFIVFLGIPHDIPIDKGMPRSAADSQLIRGLLSGELARKDNNSIVNALFSVTLSGNNLRSITEDDVAVFIIKYADEITFSRIVSGRGTTHGLANVAGVRAAILAATINGVDRELIEEMVTAINSGFIREDQSPAKVMRDALTNMKMRGGRNIKQIEGMMEEAIYDYEHGKARTQVYRGVKHPYSENIPVMEVLK